MVQDIENQVIQSQQQISMVKSQIGIKTREIRKLELTSKEVSELPSDTNVYEGVGKMWVFPIPIYYPSHWVPSCPTVKETRITRQHCLRSIGRFVFSPTAEIDKRLTGEASELKSDIKNLEKRLQYLEVTHKNSQSNMDQIFNRGGSAWSHPEGGIWTKAKSVEMCVRCPLGGF